MDKRGFTLIEMIVVIAILGVVLTAASTVLISSAKSFNISNNKANMQNQSVVISRMISGEIRNSTNFTLLETVPTTLDEDANYVYVNDADDKIYLKLIGQPAKELFNTEDVSQNIEFVYINDSNIDVNLILSKNTDEYTNLFNINFINVSENSEFTPDTTIKYSCIHFVK